jgi:superfamily II DNA/RNA helicase
LAAIRQIKVCVNQVMVASDAMTRGMDVDNVATVINYDAPVYAKVLSSVLPLPFLCLKDAIMY